MQRTCRRLHSPKGGVPCPAMWKFLPKHNVISLRGDRYDNSWATVNRKRVLACGSLPSCCSLASPHSVLYAGADLHQRAPNVTHLSRGAVRGVMWSGEPPQWHQSPPNASQGSVVGSPKDEAGSVALTPLHVHTSALPARPHQSPPSSARGGGSPCAT